MDNFKYPQRGTVVTTVHPKSLMMARVRIDGLHDTVSENDLPWAERRLPDGGAFSPLLVGDRVWVEYPYSGDSRRPVIVGFAQDASGGIANVAPEASGKGDPYQPPAVDGAPDGPKLSATKDYVYKRNGLMEVRSSGGGWAMTHLGSGSTLGLNDSGQYYAMIQGDMFLFTSGGVKHVVNGDYELEVTGKYKLTAGEVEITAGAVAIKQG